MCYEMALRWMSLDLTDDMSKLLQVMAWCHQAPSHYLSQCWPRSLLPYGITRPQWVLIGNINHTSNCSGKNGKVYLTTRGPFYLHAPALISLWISNHLSSKMWDWITYPFPNFNTIEVWEWVSNFIPHFIMDVITNPCWVQNLPRIKENLEKLPFYR